MADLPLISNFEGDFVLKLFMTDSESSMAEVAQAAAAELRRGPYRSAEPGKTMRVRLQGNDEPFPADMTASEAGLEPMNCVEVYFE